MVPAPNTPGLTWGSKNWRTRFHPNTTIATTSGWSLVDTVATGDGVLHGAWGSNEKPSKTFDMNVPHTHVRVSGRVWAMDQWVDGWANVSLDNAVQWSARYTHPSAPSHIENVCTPDVPSQQTCTASYWCVTTHVFALVLLIQKFTSPRNDARTHTRTRFFVYA